MDRLNLATADDFYRRYLEFEPTGPQRECYEKLYLAASTSSVPLLTTVVLPTGEGKTEAVAAPFLAQFTDGWFPIAPRLIYVLPSRALSDQTAERIRGYAERLPARLVVKTQHGAHPDDPFLFADVVVTTLDQFIYGYARAQRQWRGHPDLSAGSIAASMVVFDEAHGYDSYTLSLVKAMIEILYAARVPVILMSATLPDSLRQQLLPYGAEAVNITLRSSPRVKRRIPVNIVPDPLLDDSGKIPGILTARLIRGEVHKVLIVCNQVSRAQQVYVQLKKWLEEQGLLDRLPILLIHSRFTQQDREKLQRSVTNILGKNGRGGIVVSTQVCEAGLDVSAELVVTEFAPADALVQRAGRCARFQGQSGEVWITIGGDPAAMVYGRSVTGQKALDETLVFLRRNPQLDLGNWNAVQEFCKVLPYSTNEAAASESLRELQEATLYADHSPHRIRVREDLNAYFWVGERAPRLALSPEQYRQQLVSVPVRQVNSYLKLISEGSQRAGNVRLEQLVWDGKEYRLEPKAQPQAFQTYRLDPRYYSGELGVCFSESPSRQLQ